jgi:hypothetical protein
MKTWQIKINTTQKVGNKWLYTVLYKKLVMPLPRYTSAPSSKVKTLWGNPTPPHIISPLHLGLLQVIILYIYEVLSPPTSLSFDSLCSSSLSLSIALQPLFCRYSHSFFGYSYLSVASSLYLSLAYTFCSSSLSLSTALQTLSVAHTLSFFSSSDSFSSSSLSFSSALQTLSVALHSLFL